MPFTVAQFITVLEIIHKDLTKYADNLKQNCPKDLRIALDWFSKEIGSFRYMDDNNLTFKKIRDNETFLDVRISYWTFIQTIPWASVSINAHNQKFIKLAQWVLIHLEDIKRRPPIAFTSSTKNLANFTFTNQSLKNDGKKIPPASLTFPAAKPPSITIATPSISSLPSIPTCKLG